MKIIAVTASTVILEASVNEVDHLAGQKVVQTDGYYHWRPSASAVGTEFAIEPAWEQINRNKSRQEDVARVKKQLQVIIDQLDLTVPFLSEPKHEEPKEGE